MEDEQEEIDELYRTLQQQSITFYTTIKGIEGASGDQGDRLLSGKRKPESTVFNMDAAAPDAPPPPGAAALSPAGDANNPAPPAANSAAAAGSRRRGGLGCRRLFHQPPVARPRAAAVGASLLRHQRFYMLISVHIFLKIFTDMLM